MAQAIVEAVAGLVGRQIAAAQWKLDRRQTVEVKVAIPAGTPANATIPATFMVDPKVGVMGVFTIPKNTKFVLVDAFIKSTADVPVDGIARLKKNFFIDHVVTPPVSTLLVANPSRPSIPPKAWEEGDTLTIEYNNFTAVTTAQTVTFYLAFDIYVKD